MNDNKKWSKRAGVLFWWTIASFPIIWLIGMMVGNIVSSNQTGNFYGIFTTNNIIDFINNFRFLIIPQLWNSFTSFFNTLGIWTTSDGIYINILTPVLCWFIQTWLLHIVVDFILMLPKIVQKFLDKVCD